MKSTTSVFAILVLGMFIAVPVFGQTHPVSTAADDNANRNEGASNHHAYGWIGLIGLAGLAGLRRQKSEDVRRLEASGINVKTVKTT